MKNVILIGMLIGIIILVIAITKIIKIIHGKMSDEEYLKSRSKIIKLLIHCIIGISIVSIMQLLLIIIK